MPRAGALRMGQAESRRPHRIRIRFRRGAAQAVADARLERAALRIQAKLVRTTWHERATERKRSLGGSHEGRPPGCPAVLEHATFPGMRHDVHRPLALLCASLLACACSSADGSSAAVAPARFIAPPVSASETVLPSSAALPSGVSSEDATAEREPVVPAPVPALPARRHEARCEETSYLPRTLGTHSLLVDRGDSRERWQLSDSAPRQGILERESIDVGGSVLLTQVFQVESQTATLRREWTQHYDAKRRLVGVESDGQRWLRILAWDGEVPEGFQSLMRSGPFGFDAEAATDLPLLFVELEAGRHEVAASTSGASHVRSVFEYSGVEINFDGGRPSLWNYSQGSLSRLCAYEWSGTRLTKVRCANGNDTDPPPEGLPQGSEEFSWTFHWQRGRLVGLSHRSSARPVDVMVKLDAHGRIVELSIANEERRLAITRDPEGRVVRVERWRQGTNEAGIVTRYSCPAVLPQLPPLAPP